jgi:hypothetical protein
VNIHGLSQVYYTGSLGCYYRHYIHLDSLVI